MPTPTKGHRLGGSPAHERHILANLATALFQHGRITTTEAKARRLRPVAERLITFAKRGDLHARRHVLTVVTDERVGHQLLTVIAPVPARRSGRWTTTRKPLRPKTTTTRPRRTARTRTRPARDRRPSPLTLSRGLGNRTTAHPASHRPVLRRVGVFRVGRAARS